MADRALRRQEQRAMHALVRIDAGARVLDAGCGDGETLARLHAAGARAVGIDLTWPTAQRCRARGVAACVQDIEALGFGAHFDCVRCVGAIEFTHDPAQALRAMADGLRPGGRLALLFPRRGCAGAPMRPITISGFLASHPSYARAIS